MAFIIQLQLCCTLFNSNNMLLLFHFSSQVAVLTKGLKSILWNIIGPVNRWEDFIAGRASMEDLLLPLSDLVSKVIGNVDHIRNKVKTKRGALLLYSNCRYIIW